MGLAELKNSIDGTNLSVDNLKAIWKEHIQKYWIIPEIEGLADLKLDIIGDETLNADCDVTDHYVESNIAYQDQITLKPKTYTINGEVGELVWYQRDKSAQVLGQVAQKLEGVISFLPTRSSGFNQMKKTVMKASQWVDTASNAVTKLSTLVGTAKALTGLGALNIKQSLTHQEQSYILLIAMRDNRTPLSIRTPWGVLKGYVITNLEFKQPKESKDKTLITITFKEFRTTKITTTPFDEKKYQGNAAFENQPKVDQGKTSGEDVSLPTETVEDKTGKKVDACFMYEPNGNEVIATLDENGVPNFEEKTLGSGNLYTPVNFESYRYGELVGEWGTKCEKQLNDAGYYLEDIK